MLALLRKYVVIFIYKLHQENLQPPANTRETPLKPSATYRESAANSVSIATPPTRGRLKWVWG